jgi:hypothetical protein
MEQPTEPTPTSEPPDDDEGEVTKHEQVWGTGEKTLGFAGKGALRPADVVRRQPLPAPTPSLSAVPEPDAPAILEGLIGQLAARLEVLARRILDLEEDALTRLDAVEQNQSHPTTEIDLAPLEKSLTDQLAAFGRRVAKRVEELSERIGDPPRGAGPGEAGLDEALDARQAAMEGALAARLEEIRRSIRDLQVATAPIPGRVAALEAGTPGPGAAPPGQGVSPATLQAVRTQLGEELQDVREELRSLAEARGSQERVLAARLEDAVRRLEEVGSSNEALAARLTELESSLPASQGILIPDGRAADPDAVDRVDAVERRLAALERGHDALSQLTERTSREATAKLSRRVEDLRDAFGVQLAELRRVVEARSEG